MAILRGYFDLSATKPIGVTVVAGHVAIADQWASIEGPWRKNLAYWNMEDFHLSEVHKQLGEEKGSDCVRSFAKIVHGVDLQAVACGIRDEDWNAYMAQEGGDFLRKWAPTRYHAVLDMVFVELELHMRTDHKGDKVAIIVDTDFEDTSVAQFIFDTYKNGPFAQYFESLTFARRSLIPLQVADLYAGLQRRQWAGLGFAGETKEPTAPWTKVDYLALGNAQGSSRGSRGALWSFELGKKALLAREKFQREKEAREKAKKE